VAWGADGQGTVVFKGGTVMDNFEVISTPVDGLVQIAELTRMRLDVTLESGEMKLDHFTVPNILAVRIKNIESHVREVLDRPYFSYHYINPDRRKGDVWHRDSIKLQIMGILSDGNDGTLFRTKYGFFETIPWRLYLMTKDLEHKSARVSDVTRILLRWRV
jgi:hypothetical protein